MFYLLCLLPLGVAIGLAAVARRQPLGLKGMALHPFNLLGFFIVITVIDFMVAYGMVSSGESIGLAGYTEYSRGAALAGLTFFSFCAGACLLGCALGATGPSTQRVAPAASTDQAAAYIVALIAVVLAGFTVASVSSAALARGSIAYVAATKGVFFRDNPILYVLYSMLLPAFFLFASRCRKPLMIAGGFVVCALLLLPVGSRGSLAILAVGAAFLVSRKVRIPLLAVYLAAPAIAFVLTFYRWFVRDSSVYGTFKQFLDAHDGLGGALFATPEISMAESMIVNVAEKTVHRAPWDSILGVVLIPVPRAIVPFKPFGASTEFTQNANLARWMTVKGEWTVTGFVNLLMEFGYVGAFLLSGVLAFLWARGLSRSSTREEDVRFCGPVLIYFMYVFFRGDLYNLGTAIWPAVIVLVAHHTIRSAITARLSQFEARSIPQGRRTTGRLR